MQAILLRHVKGAIQAILRRVRGTHIAPHPKEDQPVLLLNGHQETLIREAAVFPDAEVRTAAGITPPRELAGDTDSFLLTCFDVYFSY